MKPMGEVWLHNVVRAWSQDTYTAHHSRTVSRLAAATGRQLGLDGPRLNDLRLAGLLHDVGKLAVPYDVLYKHHPLAQSEWSLIEAHPETGAWLAQMAGVGQETVLAIRHHHERLDGSGYPGRLIGFETCYLAQIVAVADVYSAMTHDRPYRPGLPPERVWEELSDPARFNPGIIEALRVALANARL